MLLHEMGGMFLLFLDTIVWASRPPFRIKNILKQMEIIGVNSVYVVMLTGLFTGLVMVIQIYYALRYFEAETMVGTAVALTLSRELGPVLTAIMVTARAGAAMAAEIGTMRVTEQIDALEVMATNPVQYLIVPRVIATTIILPLLTAICDFVGILGAYLLGVKVLDIEEGNFLNRIYDFVDPSDIYHGLFKAMVFGCILSIVSCYKGFNTAGGAEGVGRSTTQAVVISCISILVADYIIEALLYGAD